MVLKRLMWSGDGRVDTLSTFYTNDCSFNLAEAQSYWTRSS